MYNRNIKEQDDKVAKWQEQRILAFDQLESRLTEIKG